MGVQLQVVPGLTRAYSHSPQRPPAIKVSLGRYILPLHNKVLADSHPTLSPWQTQSTGWIPRSHPEKEPKNYSDQTSSQVSFLSMTIRQPSCYILAINAFGQSVSRSKFLSDTSLLMLKLNPVISYSITMVQWALPWELDGPDS